MHDYSEFKDGPGDNILAQIASKAKEQVAAEAKVARLEEQLKEAQAELRMIAEQELPALMDAAEQVKLTTKDGIEIQVAEAIRANIPEANKDKAFSWLEDNNHGRLIKREFKIEFGKDEEAWANKFERDLAKRKKPLRVSRKKAVNPQTLSAFVREQLAEGVSLPMDLLGVFRQRFTKVKVKTDF